jgi:hypothetical protein
LGNEALLGVPAFTGKALGARAESVAVVGAVLVRGDDGDFVVEFAILIDGNTALTVAQGVAVELCVVNVSSWQENRMWRSPWRSLACL